MIERTPDWDNPRSLIKIVKKFDLFLGRKLAVETRNDQARLIILKPREEITSYMSVAELRALVEGMSAIFKH